jgi:hypothetical protein
MNGAGHEPSQRGQIVQAVLVDEHLDVGRGQREATLARLGPLVVDLQDARHGLLLEPLADVSFRRRGS